METIKIHEIKFVLDQLINTWELLSPEEMLDHLAEQTGIPTDKLEKTIDLWYKDHELRADMYNQEITLTENLI